MDVLPLGIVSALKRKYASRNGRRATQTLPRASQPDYLPVGHYPSEVWESAIVHCDYDRGSLETLEFVPVVLDERSDDPSRHAPTRGRRASRPASTHRGYCNVCRRYPRPPASSMNEITSATFVPSFRFVNRNGRSFRIFRASRSIIPRSAPTRGARSILLMTSRSDRVIPGPPFRGILSPADTSMT